MTDAGDATLAAHRCPNGHVTYPGHAVCPDCGENQTATVDLSEKTGTVVTWTESRATPPGVRRPNTVAIVEFELEGAAVRVVGGTTGEVATGDAVCPVSVEQLRTPGEGLREPDSQEWSGFRFEPA